MFTFSEANVSVNLMIHSLRLPWHCGTVAKVVRSLFVSMVFWVVASWLLTSLCYENNNSNNSNKNELKKIQRPQSLNDSGAWIQIGSIFLIIITPLFKIALNLRKEIQVSCTTVNLYN